MKLTDFTIVRDYRIGRLNLSALLLATCLASLPATAAPHAPLVAQNPAVVPGAHGGFDFMQVDAVKRRLLVAHAGNRTLDVLNLDSGAILAQIPVGTAQGVAVDAPDNEYFVSESAERAVAVVNRTTLKKTGSIPLSGPGDDILYDPQNKTVYATHDDGAEVWIINPRTQKVMGSVVIPGVPEVIGYDRSSNRLYQNIKDKAEVAIINPSTNAVIGTWSTGAALMPHGLAIDAARHRLYAAGGNGQLAVIDTRSGHLDAVVPIAPHVDQIAFDAGKGRIYCASGTGIISVLKETKSGAVLLGNVAVPKRAHTIAVDPKTHAVWISYGSPQDSHVLRLVAQ